MVNIIEKSKELRYVSVYNKLFKMINEGTFPIDCRLPSEPDLSKRLGVSRTTLRQALSLLQDDGLIKNIQGKGNFIIKPIEEKSIGLETIGNIIYKSLHNPVDSVEISFHIEDSTDYCTKVLGRETTTIISIDRWYKSKENALAYTYTIIPIETISTFNINLDNNDELLNFIENEIYNKCSSSSINIKFSSSGKFVTKKYSISDEDKYHLIEESIYSNSPYPIAFNKHYLPLSNASINIHATKK